MDFVTIADLNEDILNGLYKIPKDIDLIVGIPRSGMLVATIIALYMNKPLTDIDGYIRGDYYSSGNTKNTSNNIASFEEVKKVLIVEDSSHSGKSVREAKEKLENVHPAIQKMFFAAYVTDDSKKNVDIWLKVLNDRIFEWNYMHHAILAEACVDIDGILCVDPTPEENDDGEKYLKFLRNAKPKYMPTRKIGYLVTSRLEKYRAETETWLKENGIEYGQLIMLDGVTAEQRKKMGNHGKFKAKIYKSIPEARLFIESEPSQAGTISEISHKDVFCPQGSLFFKESKMRLYKRCAKKRIHEVVYRIASKLPGYQSWKHVVKKYLKR